MSAESAAERCADNIPTSHYVHGVPVRKTPAILEDLTGVRLTQGAITQDAMKQTREAVGATFEALRALVPEQPVVHTDDTGWRVGGESAFLMAFVNPSLSVYQVRPQHRNEEVREMSWSATAVESGGGQERTRQTVRPATKDTPRRPGISIHIPGINF